VTVDWLTTLGTAAGSAWLSGINLYATLLTLGVLQRFHLVKLPGGLDMLGEWRLIGLAFGSTILMAFFPVLMLVIVLIFLIATIWLIPKIIRAKRRLTARIRGLFGNSPREAASP
jgi:hypothetical protein